VEAIDKPETSLEIRESDTAKKKTTKKKNSTMASRKPGA
jgi:hypothetical protein